MFFTKVFALIVLTVMFLCLWGVLMCILGVINSRTLNDDAVDRVLKRAEYAPHRFFGRCGMVVLTPILKWVARFDKGENNGKKEN